MVHERNNSITIGKRKQRIQLAPRTSGGDQVNDCGRIYFEISRNPAEDGSLISKKRGAGFKFDFQLFGISHHDVSGRVCWEHFLEPGTESSVTTIPWWQSGDMDNRKVRVKATPAIQAADIVFLGASPPLCPYAYPTFSGQMLEALGTLVKGRRRVLDFVSSPRTNNAPINDLPPFYLVDLEQTDVFTTDVETGHAQLCYHGTEHLFLPSFDRVYFPYALQEYASHSREMVVNRFRDWRREFVFSKPAVLLSLQAMEALRAAGRHGAFDYEVKPRFPYIYGEDALQMIEDIKDFPPFDPLMPDSDWPGPLVEYALGHGYRI